MTEKEKRAAGLLYDAGNDPELLDELMRCKDLCFEYNYLLRPTQTRERDALMRRILGGTGERFLIQSPFWCDFGCNTVIGENFYANHNCVILDTAPVVFGANVLVGPDCGFYAAGHPLDADLRRRGLEFARPITVGDDVWFGGGVRVLPGVSIGAGSIIGAGSVVTRDIPAGVVAAGNPCRILRPAGREDAESRPIPPEMRRSQDDGAGRNGGTA